MNRGCKSGKTSTPKVTNNTPPPEVPKEVPFEEVSTHSLIALMWVLSIFFEHGYTGVTPFHVLNYALSSQDLEDREQQKRNTAIFS